MKVSVVSVLLFNICFRLFILIHLLRDNAPQKQEGAKPVKQWMDPVAKRVFLISINGLSEDFLLYNSTPYLQGMVRNYGFAGIVNNDDFETSEGGLKAILTGRDGYSLPIRWMRPRCYETILRFVKCHCGMGSISSELPLKCYYPERDPLPKFFKLPKLFDLNHHETCLYIISFSIDPVLGTNYEKKLREIDEDVRLLDNTVNGVWDDNKTTFVVTSGRGSPVGNSLSVHSPIVAWGKGIIQSNDVWLMRHNDISAMLCVLLGINFPTGLTGVVPTHLMDLSEYYKFEWALYTIKHIERVLEIDNDKDYLFETAELEVEQLYTRLNTIILNVNRAISIRWVAVFAFVILLQVLWGMFLISVSACGYAQVVWNKKQFFTLIAIVGITLIYYSTNWELKVTLELLLWFMFQNIVEIRQVLRKFALKSVLTVLSVLAGFVLALYVGNRLTVPILLVPVIFWPVCNGSCRRLNVLVLLTRFVSGAVLCVLPFSRPFGVMPDPHLVIVISILFLFQYYVLLNLFKQSFDVHTKTVYLIIVVTFLHLNLVYKHDFTQMLDVVSVFTLLLFFLTTYTVSGMLLHRFLKIFLSLFIPVQLFSIRNECIFYFVIVFHMFTWVFVEYHNKDPGSLKFSSSIFSVEANKFSRPASYSLRKVNFFITYAYVSYFAIGHYPDLHFYDFYVVPTFFFQYPPYVSFILAIIKFALPFFVLTLTFIVITTLEEKDCEFQMVTFLWASDIIGCLFIFSFGFLSKIVQRAFLPAKLSYFVIQQCAAICSILSYFLGKHLLLRSDTFSLKIFQGSRIFGN